MRVLLLCTDAYGGHGGIALFNRQLVAALAAHPECEEVVVLPRIIVRDQEPVPPKVDFVSGAARGKVAYLRAVRRVARKPFDLIICGHVNLLRAASLAGGRPLLVTHGIEAWKPRDAISNRLLRRVRAVVSVSELTRERLLSWSRYAGPAYVLPNSIRLESYGIRPRRPDLLARYGLEGKRVLLTLGRVAAAERYKGFDEVIEVMPQLDRDIVYVIAGSGNDIGRLQRKAGDLGVFDRVVFTGFVAEDEKADFYALADVFVMPSRGEGFGFVLLEAMACGVPAIASKHDGGREALRGGALGRLVDPASPAEIRVAINDSLASRERTVPEGIEFFSFERFVERVHAIADEVSS